MFLIQHRLSELRIRHCHNAFLKSVLNSRLGCFRVTRSNEINLTKVVNEIHRRSECRCSKGLKRLGNSRCYSRT